MITLEQAIDLATQAHNGQWRNPIIINYTQLEELIGSSYACDLQAGCFKNNVYKCNDKLITKIGDDSYYYSKPYITHPLAVMEMMDTEEEKILAVLHDVLKHNERFRFPIWHKPYSPENSKMIQKIWAGLQVLTKEEHESYDKYIHYISLNKLATKVKIADIIHNLFCSPSEEDKQKYLKALPILLKSI